jgi:hypothetical protein
MSLMAATARRSTIPFTRTTKANFSTLSMRAVVPLGLLARPVRPVQLAVPQVLSAHSAQQVHWVLLDPLAQRAFKEPPARSVQQVR